MKLNNETVSLFVRSRVSVLLPLRSWAGQMLRQRTVSRESRGHRARAPLEDVILKPLLYEPKAKKSGFSFQLPVPYRPGHTAL